MLEPFTDAAGFALSTLALPVAVFVAGSLATAKLLGWRRPGQEVADHDRRAAELNEDLRRWVRDRDREALERMGQIREQATVRGVAGGGALRAAAGKVYRQVLHEYRDAASVKQRELEALVASEGRAHTRIRRCRERPFPRLRLPDDCCALLEEWRKRAEDDPTRPELEPRLSGLERASLAA